MKTYLEKLRDPRWQKKRLEILQRDEFKCRECGDTSTELHVHHLKYRKSKNPWDSENDELITLCKNCHFIIEDIKQKYSLDLYFILRDSNLFLSTSYSHKNKEEYFDLYLINENTNCKHIMSINQIHMKQLKNIFKIIN